MRLIFFIIAITVIKGMNCASQTISSASHPNKIIFEKTDYGLETV
jgi:hypothetical protein